jgi:hypothetical protein
MLSMLERDLCSGADVADLRARADHIYQEHKQFGAATLAADFLRRYRDLIA